MKIFKKREKQHSEDKKKWNMLRSIKNQLILVTLLLVIIPFTVSNIISYFFISQGFQDSIEVNNQTLASSISDNVSAFIEKAYSTTEEIAHMKDVKAFVAEEQKRILVDTLGRHAYFDLLYIQGTDGMQTARSTGDNGDRSGRWWFKQIMGDKQPFVSKSYYSVNGNVPVTSVILPINDDASNLVGVMASDIKLDALQAMVEKFSKNKNSFVYIIDGEGVVIAHPDKQQISELYNYKMSNKTLLVKDSSGNIVKDEKGNQKTEVLDIVVPVKLKEITAKALNGESGVAEYVDGNGDDVISAYSTIKLPGKSSNWAVITVEKKSDAMAFVLDLQVKNILVALGLILVVVFVTYFVATGITKPIINIVQLMEKASKGDLTVNSTYKSKNEIGRLSLSFSNMMINIKELMIRIDELGKSVSSSSELLSVTTEQTAASIEDVSKAITEVAGGASEQAKDAEDGVIAVTKLSQEIQIITDQINQSKDYSDQILKANAKGLEEMNILEDKTTESNKVGKEVASIVDELNFKANEINTIVETIMGISSQTNLLALNAAIEAARAGEAGRGFAVVADEVRKLAENTSQSSNNVKDIIAAIQQDVKRTQDAIKASQMVSNEQNKAVMNSKETFAEISNGINVIVDRINDITCGLQNIKDSREKVISVIENISAVSEETAASSEEVSASVQQQNAAADQVGTLADELHEMAKKLETTINMFKFS
jgi:methyl-accepting chemotaxis protein